MPYQILFLYLHYKKQTTIVTINFLIGGNNMYYITATNRLTNQSYIFKTKNNPSKDKVELLDKLHILKEWNVLKRNIQENRDMLLIDFCKTYLNIDITIEEIDGRKQEYSFMDMFSWNQLLWVWKDSNLFHSLDMLQKGTIIHYTSIYKNEYIAVVENINKVDKYLILSKCILICSQWDNPMDKELVLYENAHEYYRNIDGFTIVPKNDKLLTEEYRKILHIDTF